MSDLNQHFNKKQLTKVSNIPWTKVLIVLVVIVVVCGAGITSNVAQAERPVKGNAKQIDLGSNTAIELVYIPSGEFMMGSTPQERKWATGPEGGGKDGREKYEGDPRLTRIKDGFWICLGVPR